MAAVVKTIMFPKEVGKLPAYIEITLKTLSGGNFLDKLKTELINIGKSSFKFLTDTTKVLGSDFAKLFKDDNTNTGSDTLDQLFSSVGNPTNNYFKGEDKLIFVTYIPANFEAKIMSNWQEGELFGGINTVMSNLDSVPIVGSLMSKAYNALKNNVSVLSNKTLTPKMIKLYQPNFLDFDLSFDYIIDSKEESKEFLQAMRIFQESQIPYNINNSDELFEFPAIFDIKIRINYQSPDNIVSTKDDDSKISLSLWETITKQNGFGLTNFKVTPLSGESLDMKFRSDGSNAGYNVTMSFTSLRKMFSSRNVNTRIDELLK